MAGTGPDRGNEFEVTDLTNREFIEEYAGPARVGLAGGSPLVDRAIRVAQKKLRSDGSPSLFSHAFIFSGRRVDGHHWVLESDIEIHSRQMRLGVQENRAEKYFSEKLYPNLAILDFRLDAAGTRRVLTAGLDLLAGLTRYSLRELVGTLLALQRPTLRERKNLLAREGFLYCSALVQHCYAAVGIEFTPHVVEKNTTPEDIAVTKVAHDGWFLRREKATAVFPRGARLKPLPQPATAEE